MERFERVAGISRPLSEQRLEGFRRKESLEGEKDLQAKEEYGIITKCDMEMYPSG